MVAINADTFKKIFGLEADFDDEKAEEIIDLAVDLLNLYGDADLANMGGATGSKTLNLESKQKGAVFVVARAIYYGFYNEPGSQSFQGQGGSMPDVMASPAVMLAVKEAARQLAELDVDYG